MPNPSKSAGGKLKQLSIESAFGIRQPKTTTSSGGASAAGTTTTAAAAAAAAAASSTSSGSRPGPVRNTSVGTSSRYFRAKGDTPSSSFASTPSSALKEKEDESIPDEEELGEKMEGIEQTGKESQDTSDSQVSTARTGSKQTTDGKYVTLKFSPPRNEQYADVAKQNQRISPVLLDYLYADTDEKPWSYIYDSRKQKLGASYCPGYKLPAGDLEAGRWGCRIKVVDGDSYDVACELLERHKAEIAADSQNSSTTSIGGEYPDFGPAVLNMANKYTRGGGWLKGCMAQEEELCYRSTLWTSLPRKFYPMGDTKGIYTNFVAVYRSRAVDGHKISPTAEFIYETNNMDSKALISSTPPSTPLPIVSVISIAAVRDPEVVERADGTRGYKHERDRDLMKSKIRLTLQIAAFNGHRRLVLGALGCGAFNNPNLEVVKLFKEVFEESEFQGGWWKEIVFAVLDTEKDIKMKGKNGQGNYGVFYRSLHGVVV